MPRLPPRKRHTQYKSIGHNNHRANDQTSMWSNNEWSRRARIFARKNYGSQVSSKNNECIIYTKKSIKKSCYLRNKKYKSITLHPHKRNDYTKSKSRKSKMAFFYPGTKIVTRLSFIRQRSHTSWDNFCIYASKQKEMGNPNENTYQKCSIASMDEMTAKHRSLRTIYRCRCIQQWNDSTWFYFHITYDRKKTKLDASI